MFSLYISLLIFWWYIFRTFEEGKGGKEDEGEAHMVYSDHEQTVEGR